jgi:probable rRNA maturation factor
MSSAPQPQDFNPIRDNIENTPGGHVEEDRGSDYLITVQIDAPFEDRLDADRLHRLACSVLETERAPGPLEVGVVVTTDQEVRALNREYLGHDYDTDVLSFSMDNRGEPQGEVPHFVTPTERPAYLGDIAISYDRAAEQAPEYGHGPESEVAFLLIHGLLHLLGYDDADEGERELMLARQRVLLTAYWNPEG